MILRLYNTLTRSKEDFLPLDRDRVRLYVCGPTVYDRAHIGNARPLIVFDVLFRLLRHIYGPDHVVYVRNVTDVDDKINARAAERGISIRELTETTLRDFAADAEALGCLAPTIEPRATDHISEMRDMIERLAARGVAYVAEDHVLFSVSAMNARDRAPRYGALSRRSLDELIAGARVEVAPYKREPMDFVLWKPSKEGEPAWDSPCGIAARGRPGWHIECSAMSFKHLVAAFAGDIRCDPAYRNAFDIHGGGIDLVFPHHENEIAQTCCALDSPLMARFWMHNGFLQVEGQKMAKSAGNFVTIHDLLNTTKFGGRKWPGDVLRLAMLRTHYRQPIDFTLRALEEAEATLDSWYKKLGGLEWNHPPAELDSEFKDCLSDDLNTPAALRRLHELNLTAGPPISGQVQLNAKYRFRDAARMLGLLALDSRAWFENKPRREVNESRVIELIEMRQSARAVKNWAESDRIRDELAAMGIALKDNKDGATTWEIKR